MYRIKIYSIDITMTLEKQLVELPLPENAKEITGIYVSPNIYPKGIKIKYNAAVGSLTLAIPEKGDVFFNDLVKAEVNSGTWEDWLMRPSVFESNPWFISKGIHPYNIRLVDTTFITAYYEDFVNKTGIEPVSYSVRIYLHYRT